MVESNLMVVMLRDVIVAAMKEKTKKEGRCEHQVGCHHDDHVPCSNPGCIENESDSRSGGYHVGRCHQKTTTELCP